MTDDIDHMAAAVKAAGRSRDRSRGSGAVIVDPSGCRVAVAFNAFPRGVDEAPSDRHERPAKYKWTEHAERNAIYEAAREGTPTDGCTMFVSWYPCADCARAIIQSGIVELVAIEPDWADPHWSADFAVVRLMLAEARVLVRFLPGAAPLPR
jgi:dCMP deaminase